jgi:2-C-methyl-D-erythritol 4-phosphate cytidylyltransferase
MIAAIITAAGKGTRLQSNISKQFIQIYGKPILVHTLKSFQESSKINAIYLAVPADYEQYCRDEIIKKNRFTKVKAIVRGGELRQESVYNALKIIPEKCRIVAVHDGVRPLITAAEINMLISSLVRFNKNDGDVRGVLIAAPAYETVKKIGEDSIIDRTIARANVCMAQTPQVFFYRDLMLAYKKAIEDNYIGTDDSSLVERMGLKVKVIIGRHENIKITTPLDLFLAELIMGRDGKGT